MTAGEMERYKMKTENVLNLSTEDE